MFVDVKSITEKKDFADKVSKLKESAALKKQMKPAFKSIRMPAIKVVRPSHADLEHLDYVYSQYRKSIESCVLNGINAITYKDDSLLDKMVHSKDLIHGITQLSGICGIVTNDLLGTGLTLASILVEHGLERKTVQAPNIEINIT